MNEKIDKCWTLADKLRQLRELHKLQNLSPELREAQEKGFWYFLFLCGQDIDWCRDKPELWAAVWQCWQAEAQAEFEKQSYKFKIPWLAGTNPRKN